jgi:hypothetical protein
MKRASNADYSCNAGHGTFGYLGEQSLRHDLGQGDETPAGSVKLGADGPATVGLTAPSAATASRQPQPMGDRLPRRADPRVDPAASARASVAGLGHGSHHATEPGLMGTRTTTRGAGW